MSPTKQTPSARIEYSRAFINAELPDSFLCIRITLPKEPDENLFFEGIVLPPDEARQMSLCTGQDLEDWKQEKPAYSQLAAILAHKTIGSFPYSYFTMQCASCPPAAHAQPIYVNGVPRPYHTIRTFHDSLGVLGTPPSIILSVVGGLFTVYPAPRLTEEMPYNIIYLQPRPLFLK